MESDRRLASKCDQSSGQAARKGTGGPPVPLRETKAVGAEAGQAGVVHSPAHATPDRF